MPTAHQSPATSPRRRRHRLAAAAPALVVAALLAPVLGLAPGCGLLAPDAPRIDYTEAELRQDLTEFLTDFTVIVGSTADEIAQRSTDREVRRRALLWRITMVPLLQEAAYLEDPQEAWGSLLTLVVTQRQYLTEGEGQEIFGEHHELAVRATAELEAEIRAVGREFLAAAQVADAVALAEQIARRHPIRGARFTAPSREVAVSEVEAGGGLGWLIDLPMSPFSALEGIGDTPTAVREFNRTAQEFTQVVALLPRQLRWQTELLLYDVEDRETVVRGLESIESVAASIDRSVAVIQQLPTDLETLLDQRSETLEQARLALDSASVLAASLETPLTELRRTADAMERMFRESADESVGAAGGDGTGAATGGAPARPFDVREWEQATRELGRAAGELRGLTAEIHALLDPESLDRSLTTIDGAVHGAVARTEAGAQELVDHAAWRGLQLALAVFVLALVWKLVPSRRRRDAPKG